MISIVRILFIYVYLLVPQERSWRYLLAVFDYIPHTRFTKSGAIQTNWWASRVVMGQFSNATKPKCSTHRRVTQWQLSQPMALPSAPWYNSLSRGATGAPRSSIRVLWWFQVASLVHRWVSRSIRSFKLEMRFMRLGATHRITAEYRKQSRGPLGRVFDLYTLDGCLNFGPFEICKTPCGDFTLPSLPLPAKKTGGWEMDSWHAQEFFLAAALPFFASPTARIPGHLRCRDSSNIINIAKYLATKLGLLIATPICDLWLSDPAENLSNISNFWWCLPCFTCST
jgi:hypothetical protein